MSCFLQKPVNANSLASEARSKQAMMPEAKKSLAQDTTLANKVLYLVLKAAYKRLTYVV